MASGRHNVNDDGKDLFLRFLLASGYLVRRHSCSADLRSVGPPNEEMRLLLAERLKEHYTTAYRINIVDMNAVTDELWKLLDKATSDSIDGLVDSSDEGFPNLENVLATLLRSLPEFRGFKNFPAPDFAEPVVRGNEHFIHFLVDMAAIRMPGWDFFAADHVIDTWLPKWLSKDDRTKMVKKQKVDFAVDQADKHQSRPDLSIMAFNGRLALTIELKYDAESAIEALVQIGREGYLRLYNDDARISEAARELLTVIVALGVHVSRDKKVTVRAFVAHRGGGEGGVGKQQPQTLADFIDSTAEKLYNLPTGKNTKKQKRQ
jgi:hypothetical protein